MLHQLLTECKFSNLDMIDFIKSAIDYSVEEFNPDYVQFCIGCLDLLEEFEKVNHKENFYNNNLVYAMLQFITLNIDDYCQQNDIEL